MGSVAPDSETFVQDTERYRRKLLAHCYRVLGSADDAEDRSNTTAGACRRPALSVQLLDPEAGPVPAGPGVTRLQPVPDGPVNRGSADPATVAVASERVKLRKFRQQRPIISPKAYRRHPRAALCDCRETGSYQDRYGFAETPAGIDHFRKLLPTERVRRILSASTYFDNCR